MVKQRCVAVNFDDLADWLKSFGLPDDIEICAVQQTPGTTIVTITVHSEEFKPLPTKNFVHDFYHLSDALNGWAEVEVQWE